MSDTSHIQGENTGTVARDNRTYAQSHSSEMPTSILERYPLIGETSKFRSWNDLSQEMIDAIWQHAASRDLEEAWRTFMTLSKTTMRAAASNPPQVFMAAREQEFTSVSNWLMRMSGLWGHSLRYARLRNVEIILEDIPGTAYLQKLAKSTAAVRDQSKGSEEHFREGDQRKECRTAVSFSLATGFFKTYGRIEPAARREVSAFLFDSQLSMLRHESAAADNIFPKSLAVLLSEYAAETGGLLEYAQLLSDQNCPLCTLYEVPALTVELVFDDVDFDLDIEFIGKLMSTNIHVKRLIIHESTKSVEELKTLGSILTEWKERAALPVQLESVTFVGIRGAKRLQVDSSHQM